MMDILSSLWSWKSAVPLYEASDPTLGRALTRLNAQPHISKSTELNLSGQRIVQASSWIHLAQFPHLTSLNLSYNSISSLSALCLPPPTPDGKVTISNYVLPPLQSIKLDATPFPFIPPEIFLIPTLTELSLCNCNYFGPLLFPSTGHDEDNQTYRTLRDDPSTYPFAPYVTSTSLTKLNLNNSRLQSLPEELALLAPCLTTLHFSSNNLTSLPDSLWTLTHLTELQANYNKLTTLPEDISNFTGLQLLELNNNMLSALPSCLFSLASLTHLNVSTNRLTALPDSPSSPSSSLTYLELSAQGNHGTLLHDCENPSSVWRCCLSNLNHLSLSNNGIQYLPPRLFSCSPNLTVLGLYGNDLEELPGTVAQLTRLQSLWLSSNSRLTFLPGELVQMDVPNLDLPLTCRTDEEIGSSKDATYFYGPRLLIDICSTFLVRQAEGMDTSRLPMEVVVRLQDERQLCAGCRRFYFGPARVLALSVQYIWASKRQKRVWLATRYCHASCLPSGVEWDTQSIFGDTEDDY